MTLPASGHLCWSAVKTELRDNSVRCIGSAAARKLAQKPSGPIWFPRDFYGKSNAILPTTFYFIVVGGGGGGGGWGQTCGSGGGGGGGVIYGTLTGVDISSVSASVGAGGGAGMGDGVDGSDGGTSVLTLNGVTFTAGGGKGGKNAKAYGVGWPMTANKLTTVSSLVAASANGCRGGAAGAAWASNGGEGGEGAVAGGQGTGKRDPTTAPGGTGYAWVDGIEYGHGGDGGGATYPTPRTTPPNVGHGGAGCWGYHDHGDPQPGGSGRIAILYPQSAGSSFSIPGSSRVAVGSNFVHYW